MKIYIFASILLIFHILILLTLQFTAWPEMFSYPYFLNNGFKLYQDIALPYNPLLPLFESKFFQILGFNLLALKLLTWSIILINDLLIIYISLKIIGKKIISLLPLVFYILVQPLTDGNMLWFDLASVPLLLMAIASYIGLREKRLFWTGFFLCLAFFTKQQLGIVIISTFIYFLISYRSIFKLYSFILGGLMPAILFLAYILFTNTWNDFIFWTITVPTVWYPKFPGYTHWPTRNEIVQILILFGPGVYFAITYFKKLSDFERLILIILFSVFITSFPRFEFFRMQPAIAIYILIIAFLLTRFSKKIVLIMLTVVISILILIPQNIAKVLQPARFYTDGDLNTAREILQTSDTGDKVYMLGIHSLNYVLTNRLTSKPWVDNYIWYMEIPTIQERVIKGFEGENLKVIYWKPPNEGNWYDLGSYQPKKLVDYIQSKYEMNGVLSSGVEIWVRKD